MKKNMIIILLAVMLSIPGSLMADQFYGGIGLNPVSGEPDYIADGIMNINLAYETKKYGLAGWRFSYTMTNFKHSDEDSYKIKSHIIAAESMFVKKMKSGLSLIGAFGPALYSTKHEAGDSNSGMGIGLSATGSIRVAVTKSLFLALAYHYKNCAVPIDDYTLDGGYQGFFINIGLFF